ncbi:hypothetical protein VQ03_01080 [Methylobacterium tarhaniae]|uniref:Uncharacterized protein n=1 Tax=Methylobacterium tarhaniae TaxID=1187852 RepID=A0A0J6TC23_9HYPH|nr:TerB family tellurite resistance protein [Methylobacterium tarhaniae]KMO44840.1 hypothetical protein VQ03_01080 [Methylobacterium tarhaniae]
MSMLQDVIARLRDTVTGFREDEPLMAAAVSAAALVITADGEIAQEEVNVALADLITEPTLHAKYQPSALAQQLGLAIERACTSDGRGANLAMVSAIVDRPIDERNNVLLIAIDVAIARQGINADEDKMLSQLADQLAVDKVALIAAAKAQRLVTGERVELGDATHG